VLEDTDVVYVTVKRVVNQSGPQIANNRQDAVSRHKLQTVTARSACQTTEFPLPTGINERLSSMEAHVKLYAGKYRKPSWGCTHGGLRCIKF